MSGKLYNQRTKRVICLLLSQVLSNSANLDDDSVENTLKVRVQVYYLHILKS